jgi:hypothetical protein
VLGAHLVVNGAIVTAITRQWADGDDARCRLCKNCTVHRGVCQILVEGYVAPADLALYDTKPLQWEAPLTSGPRLAWEGGPTC